MCATLWTMRERLKWRERIRKANPGIQVFEIDCLEWSEERRREAEAWAARSVDFMPFVSRKTRMRLCEEVMFSLCEGLPDLRDAMETAKVVFARERKRCRKPAKRSGKATTRGSNCR
jgi:hypothetical protein